LLFGPSQKPCIWGGGGGDEKRRSSILGRGGNN
jgi:hypothetical protein